MMSRLNKKGANREMKCAALVRAPSNDQGKGIREDLRKYRT
jgi:hypothetical protein